MLHVLTTQSTHLHNIQYNNLHNNIIIIHTYTAIYVCMYTDYDCRIRSNFCGMNISLIAVRRVFHSFNFANGSLVIFIGIIQKYIRKDIRIFVKANYFTKFTKIKSSEN